MSSISPPGYGGYVGNMDYGPYGNYGQIRYPGSTGGGGGMPPAIIAGGIMAAGTIGKGILESRAANKATEASAAATDKALDFQREQAGLGQDAYQAQWEYWKATRDALAQHLGIDITPPGMAEGGGMPGGAPSGGTVGPGGGAWANGVPRGPVAVLSALARGEYTPPGGGATPGNALPPGGPSGAANPLQGANLGQLMGPGGGRWNDWSRMGLRGSQARA